MVLFLDKLKVSKSFKAFLRKTNYKVTFNKDFEFVINSCANIKENWSKWNMDYKGTNRFIYTITQNGKVISVEVWDDDEIVGGLYGIDLGDIFCGESMFSKSSNSSKVALYYLVKELKKTNISLLIVKFHRNT